MMPYPWGFGVPIDGSVACDLTEPLRLIGDMRDRGYTLSALRWAPLLILMSTGHTARRANLARTAPAAARTHDKHFGAGQKRLPGSDIRRRGYSYLGESSPYVAAGAIEDGMMDIVGYGACRLLSRFPRDIAVSKFDHKRSCLTWENVAAARRIPAGRLPVLRQRNLSSYISRPALKKGTGGQMTGVDSSKANNPVAVITSAASESGGCAAAACVEGFGLSDAPGGHRT